MLFSILVWLKSLLRRVKMAVKVSDECIGCGACVDSCPVSALQVVDDKAQCDDAACAECGACVDACPVGALSL